MPIAAGAKNPGTVAFVGIRLRVEHASERQVAVVHLRILGVNVQDRIAQNPDGGNRVDALPEHVARVVITANRRTRDGPQFQHSFGIVDQESGMHLNGDSDAMIGGKTSVRGPIRSGYVIPLPL